MNQNDGLPEPQRKLISTRSEYLEAFEFLLGSARRELRIFDPDLSELGFNEQTKIQAMRRLLAATRFNRIFIAVHDIEHAATRCPRLIELLSTYPQGLLINQTEGDAARAQDRFVLADESHVVRRPVARQGRGAWLLDDPKEAHGMRERFDQIWESSTPAVSANKTGL